MTTRVCTDTLEDAGGGGGERAGENEPGRKMSSGGKRKDKRQAWRDWEDKGTRQGSKQGGGKLKMKRMGRKDREGWRRWKIGPQRTLR